MTAENALDQLQAKFAKREVKVLNNRSKLYNVCDAYKWKHPVYECCKEEGPAHLRMFTFKVVIEIKKEPSEPNTEVECFSAPKLNKKAAAEHAAEGALWYLKKVGYD
ncbi:ribonuclease 3-like protein 1 [Rosa sericea]